MCRVFFGARRRNFKRETKRNRKKGRPAPTFSGRRIFWTRWDPSRPAWPLLAHLDFFGKDAF
jgi:hypothetical protein